MAPSGFSTILVPTDRLETPREALEIARSLARCGARLIVARVGADFHESPAGLEPDPSFEVVTRRGPAAEAVVALAAELGCELIVIGDDGRARQGVERLLMGSIAQEVLRHAACPVLCFPVASSAPDHFATTSTTDIGSFLRID